MQKQTHALQEYGLRKVQNTVVGCFIHILKNMDLFRNPTPLLLAKQLFISGLNTDSKFRAWL